MTALHIAVEGDAGWVELTAGTTGDIHRFRAPDLREAARRTASSDRPAFVDIELYLAESVPQAFAGLRRARPGWRPGATGETLLHAGTAATAIGLLRDIAAVGVADGVTLRPADPSVSAAGLLDELLPALRARGLVEVRSRGLSGTCQSPLRVSGGDK
ncbi:hypothetical protein [Gordonia sp. (in: high G+C Gram-positive bacteria)]|uniref:hypothetical protein n=1 Tax=Gordonia sp. (in: high G+C Gram-positive bacteria) TaxID=84139 RepID=UPI0039E6E4C6